MRGKPQETRQLKVAKEIHRVLLEEALLTSDLVRKLENITMLRVEMVNKLKTAKVFFLTRNITIKQALENLNFMKNHFRRALARELRMRYVPDILFVYDKSGEIQLMLEEALIAKR